MYGNGMTEEHHPAVLHVYLYYYHQTCLRVGKMSDKQLVFTTVYDVPPDPYSRGSYKPFKF